MTIEAPDFPLGMPGLELLALLLVAMVAACAVGGTACTSVQNPTLRKLISPSIQVLFAALFVISFSIPLVRSTDEVWMVVLYSLSFGPAVGVPLFAGHKLIILFAKHANSLHELLVANDRQAYITRTTEVFEPAMNQLRADLTREVQAEMNRQMSQFRDRLETMLQQRLNEIEGNFSGIAKECNSQLGNLSADIKKINSNVNRLDEQQKHLDSVLMLAQRTGNLEVNMKRLQVDNRTILGMVAILMDRSENMDSKKGRGTSLEQNTMSPTGLKINTIIELEEYGIPIHQGRSSGIPDMLEKKTGEESSKVPIYFQIKKLPKSAKLLTVTKDDAFLHYTHAVEYKTDLVLCIVNTTNGRKEIRIIRNKELRQWSTHTISTGLIDDDEKSKEMLDFENQKAIAELGGNTE